MKTFNSSRRSSWFRIATLFLSVAGTAITANAGLVTNAVVTGQSGGAGPAVTCIPQIGLATATLGWSATGAYLNAPGGSSSGCFVGAFSTTTGLPIVNTEALFINIGGSSGANSAAQLANLETGWYALGLVSGANTGAICNGTSLCVWANNNDGGSNSGVIHMLVNQTAGALSFTVKNAAGVANSIANLPSAPGCGASANQGNTYQVAANTICFSDLTTGGSISITVAAPGTTAIPEPATFSLTGLGLAAAGLIMRRRAKRA